MGGIFAGVVGGDGGAPGVAEEDGCRKFEVIDEFVEEGGYLRDGR